MTKSDTVDKMKNVDPSEKSRQLWLQKKHLL